MSGFNGKGPEGQGSQTGLGLGKCNSYCQNSDNNVTIEDYSRGRGRRKGKGFGFKIAESVGKGSGKRFCRFTSSI